MSSASRIRKIASASSHFFGRGRKRGRRRFVQRKLGLESLEARRLLAQQVVFDTEALAITGDDSDPQTFYGAPFTTQVTDETVTYRINGKPELPIGDSYFVEGPKAAALDVSSLTLFADTDATNVTGTVDSTHNSLSLTAETLSVNLGGIFQASASGVPIHLRPDKVGDVFHLSAGTATAPALESDGLAPTIEFTGLGLDHLGNWSIATSNVVLPAGYSNTINVANQVTVTLSSFEDPTAEDLNAAELRSLDVPVELLGIASNEFVGGTISQVAIGANGDPQLAGVSAGLAIPRAAFETAFSFLPVQVTKFEVHFGPDFPSVPDDFDLVFSGGLRPSIVGEPPNHQTLWPITAQLDNVRLDVGAFRRGDFPLEHGAVVVGIEPFQFGPLQIGGVLGFGVAQITEADGSTSTALYAQVTGKAHFQSFDLAIDLVISEFGPVLASFTAPVAVPLGPTGLMLRQVAGGIRFGQEVPDVDHPDELQGSEFNLVPRFGLTNEDIAQSITLARQNGQFTWDAPFSVYLRGVISSVGSTMITGNVTLLTNSGAKLLGIGDLFALGMNFASARMLLDFTDPINSLLLGSFRAPSPQNPLGFLLPFNADLRLRLDTEGIVLGSILGARAFVESAASDLFADVVQRLEADHTRPLAEYLLDVDGDGVVSPLEDAAVITPELMLNRLRDLLPNNVSDLLSAGAIDRQVVEPVSQIAQAVTQEFLETMTDLAASTEAAQAAFENLNSVFADALLAAVNAAGQVFDPSLTVTGALQPVLFGIPLGPPDAELSLTLDKTGFFLQSDFSLSKVATRFPPLSGPIPLPFPVPISDSFMADIELPFGPLGVTVIDLLNGNLPSLEPSAAGADQWSVVLGGGVNVFNMPITQLTGLAFPAQWSQLDDRFQRTFDSTDVTGQIPISEAGFFNNLETYGGVVLAGQLFAPQLLTDPLRVIPNLEPPPAFEASPDYPRRLAEWFADMLAQLSQVEESGHVVLFVPSFGSLLETNFDDYDRELPSTLPTPAGERPRLSINADPSAVAEIIRSAFLEGAWQGKLLGLQLGNAQIRATAESLSVNGTVPTLGVNASFSIASQTIQVPGPNGTLVDVELPTIAAEAMFGGQELSDALRSLGLPGDWLPSGEATFRAYSPGFDPLSSDRLQQTGGIELSAQLSIPGLLSNAEFQFSLTPSADGSAIPDFVARASVDNFDLWGDYGGLSIDNATVEIRKVGSDLTIHIIGDGTFLGQSVAISGTLNPDLSGSLHLDFSGGLSVAGLNIDGSFDLTRTSAGAVSLAIAGSTSFIGNNLNVNGNLSFSPSGVPNGTLALAVQGSSGQFNLGGFRLNTPASSAALRLTISGSSAVVDVSARISVPGLPNNVAIAGSLNTANGAGSLSINAFGGLRIGSTSSRLYGDFVLSRSSSGVVALNVADAGFDLAGLRVINLNNFSINSTGAFSATMTFLGTPVLLAPGIKLTLSPATLSVNPSTQSFRFILHQASTLAIAGGPPVISVPATNLNLSLPLSVGGSATFDLGSLNVNLSGSASQNGSFLFSGNLSLPTVSRIIGVDGFNFSGSLRGNVFVQLSNSGFAASLSGSATMSINILGETLSASTSVFGSINSSGQVTVRLNLPDVIGLDLGSVSATFDLWGGSPTFGGPQTVITNRPPTARPGGPYFGNEGRGIALSGAASSDPQQLGDSLTYRWDLDGDGRFGEIGSAAARGGELGITPIFSAPDNGTYSIALVVIDLGGLTHIANTTVTVRNVNPIVQLNAPASSEAGTPIVLTGAATDAGPLDTHTFSWRVLKDNANYASGSGNVISFTPDDNGNYDVMLTATDDDGGVGSRQRRIAVTNVTPPSPRIEVGPEAIPEGTPIFLASSVFDKDGDSVFTYAWQVTRDGTLLATSTNAGFTFIPDDDGMYDVSLTATDPSGNEGSTNATIVVTNVAPTATMSAAPAEFSEGTPLSLTGSFVDPGSADTHTLSWTVTRDGVEYATGEGAGLTFTPDESGNYEIAFDVQDDDGGIGMQVVSIVVTNVAPTATLSADNPVEEGGPIAIGLSEVFDPSSADAAELLYSFDFDNDGIFDLVGPDPTATFTFADDGSYAITGRVDDKDGGFNEYTTTVVVTNVAPTANAGFDLTVAEGDPVTVTGMFSDPGQNDTHTFLWQVAADNGQVVANGASDEFSFTPADNGVYTLTFTVTDDDGGIGSDTATITVTNVAPQNVNAGPDQIVNEGDTVTLTGTFTDPGSADTHTYQWQVAASNGQVVANGPGQSFSFIPNDNGIYTVTFSVSDDNGATTSVTLALTVNNVIPDELAITGPQPNTPVRGQTIGFAGDFSDAGSADTHQVHWDFGDGTTLDFGSTDDAGALSPAHTYTAAGIYTVTMSIRDDDVGVNSVSRTVTVVAMALQPDPWLAGGTALVIGGTTGADLVAASDGLLRGHAAGSIVASVTSPTIVVDPVTGRPTGTVTTHVGVFSPTPTGFEAQYERTIGGVVVETDVVHFEVAVGSISRIIAYGQDGTDAIALDPRMSTPAILDGGQGNDILSGAGGHDVLLGDAGNDILNGGGGRDLLVGGDGTDGLYGGRDDDILIAGILNHEQIRSEHEALSRIMAEWSSPTSYSARIANLLQNLLQPGVAVLDDGSRDILKGGGGGNDDDRTSPALDWYFADTDRYGSWLPEDAVFKRRGETVTELDGVPLGAGS